MEGKEVAERLAKLLSFEELEAEARDAGALRRQVKKLHPVRMLEAMLCTRGQRDGRLSAALWYLEDEYGIKVNRSSFYQRLTEGYSRFVHQVTERVLAMQVNRMHPELQGRLEAFRDIWAYDSTTIRLRQALAKHFSSGGSDPKAGIKLHAGIRIRSGVLLNPKVTEERVSDQRAMDLGSCCEDVLILLDRGYSAHAMFASIGQQKGLYLTRLKASANPVITAVREAAGGESAEAAVGKRLDDAIADGNIVLGTAAIDVDVELALRKGGTMAARVVGLPHQSDQGGHETWWYLTNLPAEDYEPDVLGKLYVLRWQVELLWKQLKSNFRVDEMHVLTEHNARMVMDLCILGYVLTLGVIHACTTPEERSMLSITMVGLLMDRIARRLANLIEETDSERRAMMATALRDFILHRGRDPNPKRARLRALNQLQGAKIAPVSRVLLA